MQDGLSHYEANVVTDLELAAESTPEIFWTLISHPDIETIDENTGQLSTDVGEVARAIMQVTYYDRDNSLRPSLMDMPFLKTIEKWDSLPLSLFSELLAQSPTYPDEAERIASHPSLSEGITDEQPLSVALLYIEGRDPELATEIAALPWIEDGLDESEFYAARQLQDTSLASLPLLRAVVSKPWVRDGLDLAEEYITYYLTLMSGLRWHSDPPELGDFEAEALQILQMPFLETVEIGDASALRSLHNLLIDGYLEQVLSHPKASQGITDEQVPGVSVLPLMTNYFERFIDILLDTEKTIVEQRTITLPLAREVLLTMIHTGSGGDHIMDSLERAVRSHEEFMNTPLPQRYVVLLITEAGLHWGIDGSTIHVDAQTFPDVEETIAQVTAHFYFTGRARWMWEGTAVFLERVSQGKTTDSNGFNIGVDSCERAYSLTVLENLRWRTSAKCASRMGSGLFYDLYHGLGEEVFRRGFRDLHLNIEAESLPGIWLQDLRIDVEEEWYDGISYDNCSRLRRSQWSLCHMKAAFVAGSDPEIATKADAILKLWFFARPENDG